MFLAANNNHTEIVKLLLSQKDAKTGAYISFKCQSLPNRKHIVFTARINDEIEKYFYDSGIVYVGHIYPETGSVRYETREDLRINPTELDNIISDFFCGRENKILNKL